MSCTLTCFKGDVTLLPCCQLKIGGKGIYSVTSVEESTSGAIINYQGGSVSVGNLTTIDGENLASAEAVYAYVSEWKASCCIEDPDPDYEAVAVNTFDACLNGLKVKFKLCKNEVGEEEYIGSNGAVFTDYATIWASGYTVDCVEKVFIDTQWYFLEDEKQPIAIDRYFDSVTWCYVLAGQELNDSNLITNIENYTMANDVTGLGQLSFESPITITEIPYQADGLTICADATDQDVVALIQASVDAYILEVLAAGYVAPDGGALGLSSVVIQQHATKKQVHCDIANTDIVVSDGTQLTTVGLANTSFITVNGGRKKFGRPLFDNGDCKGCANDAGLLVAGDVTVNGAVGAAYQVDFCVACFAPAV